MSVRELNTFLIIFFVLAASTVFTDGLKVTSVPEKIIAKEDEPRSLWCAVDSTVETCSWSLPDGTTCKFGTNLDRNCVADKDIHYTGSGMNCSIKVDKIQDDQSGIWTCTISSLSGEKATARVEVEVAIEPDVEIKDVFGTVTVFQGQPRRLDCEAQGGKLQGKFIWLVGERKEGKDNVIIANDNQPVVTPADKDGHITVTETLTYYPNVAHQDKNLYCLYTLSNEYGRVIHSKDDHVTLKIYYLEEPLPQKVEVPQVEAGLNLTINLEFGAHPKPEAQDIVWKISSSGDEKKIVTDEAEVVRQDHYLALPLETIGENRFRVTLVILNVELSELKKDHSVQISTRPSKGLEPFHSVTHRFALSVSAHNEQGGGPDGELIEESGTSNVTLIVVIVLVVVVALLAAAGAVFYAWKSQRWCFGQAGTPRPAPSTVNKGQGGLGDPELAAPLNQDDPNTRPIIKNKYSRPS